MPHPVRYLLLHRALRNAGDFLIFERARRLIGHLRPEATLETARGWRPLDEQMREAELAAFDAIVICGGPGYQRAMYPRVYPLTSLSRLRAPLFLLALGSYAFPADAATIGATRLDPQTLGFLAWVRERGGLLSARDAVTGRILAQSGCRGVPVTGDPAWYDLDRLGREWTPPGSVDRIAFTPPANPLFARDALGLLRALRDRFPSARIEMISHRDLQPAMVEHGTRLGAVPVDISGGADGFRIYHEVDLHVGYRLHAHLYCLGRQRLSYLVAEDSRGVGALETLGELGVNPFATPRRGGAGVTRLGWRAAGRLGWGSGYPARIGRSLLSTLVGPSEPSAASVIRQIETDLESGLERHRRAGETIVATYPVMRRAIEALP